MKKLRKYRAIAKTSLQNNLVYTSNFLVDTLFYAFIIFVFLQLWRTVYGGRATLSGYTLNQMIWYCIVTEMVIHCGTNIFTELNNDIKDGSIAYFLNKPYNYILYQLSNSLGQIAVKALFNVTAGIVMGLVYVGPLTGFRPDRLPFILLSAAMGILLHFFSLAAIGMTAFWMEENRALFWIYQKLAFMLGMFLPIEFFPPWVQGLAFALPFPYITYAPAKLAVDFSPGRFLAIGSIQAAYLLFFILISSMIYLKGVKKLNVNGG